MSDVAAVVATIGELRAWAHIYADAGLEVFPLLANKAPRTEEGFKDASLDHDQIEDWWTRHPDDLIGHRIAPHHVLLDIDPRHGGLDTWKAIREACGGFPVTRGHQSGRGDGGGHMWWLRPDDKLTSLKLDAWARDHQVGHPILDKAGQPILTGGIPRWTSGIDILHHDLRYTILPPSPHPESGAPYSWIDGRGLDVTPAPMPAFLADLLTIDPAPPPPSKPRTVDPSSIADWYSQHHTIGELLREAGWQCVAGDGHQDGSRWRHPTASSSCSATVRHGCLFVYTPNTPFDVTNPGDSHGYTPFRAYTVLRHHGDASNAARAARELKDGPQAAAVRINPADLIAPPVEDTPAAPTPADSNLAYLPDTVWDARPVLTHIRDAARHRRVAPDAVLACILARVAAISPHTLELNPQISTPVGLTFYAALVGPPESGKSAAAALAAELLPAPRNVPDRVPIGSGEGFIDLLFDYVKEPDDQGKMQRVKRQTKHAAIFHIDEGQALNDLANRSGSTLMPTLRSAWSHSQLGQANASLETRRLLDGKLYVYGVTLGIQPELAGPLLNDQAGGTPQRFLWAMATDPQAPTIKPDWPGELDWQPPGPHQLEPLEVRRGGYGRHPLQLEPSIVAELDADRVTVTQGREDRRGDEHRMLRRLKTAALLALLDGRVNVNLEDWALADQITSTSRHVRAAVEHTLTSVNARNETAIATRQARRELVVEDTKTSRALQSAARSIAKLVHRHAGADHADQPGCVKSCLTRAVASKHRALIDIDDAVDEAVRLEWIIPESDRWLPGRSQPV